MTSTKIVTIAKKQVGTKATDVKKCKYNNWFYGSTVSGSEYDWCETFVQWVFKECGASSLLYNKTANCGVQARAFLDKGRLIHNGTKVISNSKLKIGDVVFFHWNFDRSTYVPDCYSCDHVGIVVGINGDGTIQTIEGNTGSSYNGEVMYRTRSMSVVSCAGRPDYKGTTPTPSSKTSKPKVLYRVKVDGKWLKEVDGINSYAGAIGKDITDIAIKVTSGKIKYRVHIKGGDWLPYVTGYDIKDIKNGYAGNGKIIDAFEGYYYTPADVYTAYGYFKLAYRVSPKNKGYYSWQYDNETSGNQDGYAGSYGKSIDRIQIALVN